MVYGEFKLLLLSGVWWGSRELQKNRRVLPVLRECVAVGRGNVCRNNLEG